MIHYYEYDCPSCGIDYDFESWFAMDTVTVNRFECMRCRQLLVVTSINRHEHGEQLEVKPIATIKR